MLIEIKENHNKYSVQKKAGKGNKEHRINGKIENNEQESPFKCKQY